MILNLTHAQRLHLIAILDGMECQGRRDAWSVCKLQEQLELDDQEREHIGWRKQKTEDGREYVVWNAMANLPVREYDLSKEDADRICRALEKAPIVLARDKNWFTPLTLQLPEIKEPANAAATPA
jgi:hypothetical protein